MTATSGFWADTFDMDLPRVFPEAAELFAPVADLPLWTRNANPTGGKINCPVSWHTNWGLTAFFSSQPPPEPPPQYWPQPQGYDAGAGVVGCTVWEMVRDEWSHQAAVALDGRLLWRPARLAAPFQALMFHLRGWRTMQPWAERVTRQAVLGSLARLAGRLGERLKPDLWGEPF
jgi:hypothetical protein